LDAFQLEIVRALRSNNQTRAAFIEHLAYAIGSLVAQYANAHTLAAFRRINLFSLSAP
jgi:hypothetical protein